MEGALPTERILGIENVLKTQYKKLLLDLALGVETTITTISGIDEAKSG